MKKNARGFSLIEILIGIFIFTLGLTAIYAVLLSTFQLNDYSKNSIIASYLAKEGLELTKNIRDTNYLSLHRWNTIPGSEDVFATGSYYTIENNFQTGASQNAEILKIPDFCEGVSCINLKMPDYQLYLDSQNRYTYHKKDNTPTHFYRYLFFEDVVYGKDENAKAIKDALKIRSKVIWYQHGYHEVQLETILTDWQQQ